MLRKTLQWGFGGEESVKWYDFGNFPLSCIPRTRQIRSQYKIMVGKPHGKRSLGRPKCRWENNITINLKYTGRWGRQLDWTGSVAGFVWRWWTSYFHYRKEFLKSVSEPASRASYESGRGLVAVRAQCSTVTGDRASDTHGTGWMDPRNCGEEKDPCSCRGSKSGHSARVCMQQCRALIKKVWQYRQYKPPQKKENCIRVLSATNVCKTSAQGDPHRTSAGLRFVPSTVS
jgi:hypothetical protein